ncbi:Gfo/Idh/MocA family oxidoreductase [Luteolibacter ambystomatis]|uniref:Gfo/Idh/MocA family oxidoreductase n=1 Tax=Luteolibacter ambystomatis TaxID=2824561 RepID=A0A975G811_9BACT|nr:Gfo/Idh/MocA family oxidoreductase [Luteolibacter ambystomatis]QUE50658.1 Gfo/Idh/MocA family oxidoreductase [Luteolibacter ambystomatis]
MQTRRHTLKTLAALATIQIVPSRVLGLSGQTPPSQELTRAIIGCGGISASHLGMPGKLLALCDVDQRHLDQRMQQAGGEAKGIKGYHDFREVLARKDIDIIHIATPPHWHALMAIEAAKAGKDIWCEKPMSRTIGEGIAMVKAVQKHERIFRLNTWFRFKDNFYGMGVPVKQIKKAVMHGLLGWPLKVTVSGVTGFDWKFIWSGKKDLPVQPVPPEFDYNFWLGPAPLKPYNAHRTHGTFRGYWDYDGGGLGDMGQHYLDPVQYILGKDDTSPISVEIDADPQDADAIGSWRRIEFTYADGCKIILDGQNKDKDAAYIEGPKGKIFKDFKSDIPDLEKKLAELPDPEPQLTDFHEAVRTRKKFALNEMNGFRSCTMVNMGVTAHRLNKSLKFDPKTLRFDDPAANALINQPMRAPWKIEV